MPIYLNWISRSTQTKLLEQWTGWLSGVHREEEIWGRKIHCGRQWRLRVKERCWVYQVAWPSRASFDVEHPRLAQLRLEFVLGPWIKVGELKEYVRGIKSALANTLRMKAIKDLVWLVGLYSERDMYAIWCANNFSARCWVHVLENRGPGVGH